MNDNTASMFGLKEVEHISDPNNLSQSSESAAEFSNDNACVSNTCDGTHHHHDGETESCSSGTKNWNIIKNPSNGRTRISQACDRCRARKIKCSGKSDTNPRCTNCEKDGFQCVVSDKLTRNSFPKGYTKNLEKKLLDVELNRNQLLLEIQKLKQKISQLENAGPKPTLAPTSNETPTPTPKSISPSVATAPTVPTAATITTTNTTNNKTTPSVAPHGVLSTCNFMPKCVTDGDGDQLMSKDCGFDTPLPLLDKSIETSRKNAFYKEKVKIDSSGLLVLDQNVMTPFESIFASLKANPFKGYRSLAFQKDNISDLTSTTSTGNSSSVSPEQLNPAVSKQLANYHMNLNRYLNLILYKLIFPLFNSDSKSANGSVYSTNSGNESNKNLDHLIWLFFNDYNKLIPILDFELFYNDYLTFVNTYTIKNSTYVENGIIKKKYYEFNQKDQDILVKLVLILRYTLCQPKINENDYSSAFLPDKSAPDQLEESIKLINLRHLMLMFKNIDFLLSPNRDKLEISLLMFYYLIKFENYNLPNYTDSLHSHKDFLLDIINLNIGLVRALNIDKPNELLETKQTTNKQLIEIQRLKLYWNFRILVKLSEIYFNIPLTDEEYDINPIVENENNSKSHPSSLESIVLVNKDIKITLCLVRLLKIIPWNIMVFVNEQNQNVLMKIDAELSKWKKSVEELYNEDDSVVFNKLKSYYLYFKVLVNINGTIDSSYFIDFINLVYDLTFNNPKSSYKPHEISIEAAESLCLHSFNFHLVTLISITSLQNFKDKAVCEKIYKLIQLYHILVNFKDVDPLITTFAIYIKENIMFSFSDATTIHDDTLKLFSAVDLDRSNNGSLFDKKVLKNSAPKILSTANQSQTNLQQPAPQTQMEFDLNAFSIPSDTSFFDETSNKRRKSTASTSSVVSSNMSLTSRESSVSMSRRLSGSSNDSMPTLFPSATSPYHNSSSSINSSDLLTSAKKRIIDYAIQPMRTSMNRSRSLSSENRLRKTRVQDRRLSGSNYSGAAVTSRENSVDSIQSRRDSSDIPATHTQATVDDSIISHFLNSQGDSELDPDVGAILNKPISKPSNFKHNSSLLPTIPSEGNLMNIMTSLETSAIEPAEKINGNTGFNLNTIFPSNSNILDSFNAFNSSLTDSNSNKARKNDFSKAFKSNNAKGSISDAFSPNSSNSTSAKEAKNEKVFIDDDDIMRLRKHVMSMKSTPH